MISIAQNSWINKCLYDISFHKILIGVFAFVLYANTLGHGFVLDDGIVITENKFVKDGLKGIPDLLSKDSFYGFFKKEGKEKLVAGGRYRPMSLIFFAVIYELFGEDPFIFHLFSILLYALLGIVLYRVLNHLFLPLLKESTSPFAVLTSLIFITHPVHTECVANIKGADEVMALFFAFLAFYYTLKYTDTQKSVFLFLSSFLFFLALLSKENALIYLCIIPVTTFLLYQRKFRNAMWITISLLIASLVFIYMRSSILGFNPFTGNSTELMNNPFVINTNGISKPMDGFDRAGIIFYSLFEYLRLLIFPHPLTHDYYPKHIPVLGLWSLKSIIAMITYGALMVYALFSIKKNPVFTVSIMCYLLPLFLVSNILFPVGTNMGERFLFMPSVGFCIALTYILIQKYSDRLPTAFYICSVIILLYSIKTISRNPAWSDNLTLFTTDAKVSKNSAKIHNGIAGVLLEKVPELSDSNAIKKITTQARMELQKALAIHPLYAEAQLQLGNINYFEKNYGEAIKQYNIVLKRLPEDEDAFKNLQLALREQGRQVGMQTGNIQLAKDYLRQSLGMNPKDPEAVMLMGIAEGSSGNFTEALRYFYKAIEIEPQNAQAYFNLGITYKNTGDMIRADSMFLHASSLDPGIFEKNGMNAK